MGMRTLGSIVALVVALGVQQPATAQPFEPVRKLTTWYTDRSLIDIEVVGSNSFLPDVHRLEPERVLRFRLERAYVQFLSPAQKAGFDIVYMIVDWPTGLPDALIIAASNKGRLPEDMPGIPSVPHSERVKRSLIIKLRSDVSAAGLATVSRTMEQCRGAPLGDGLLAYDRQLSKVCGRPYYSAGGTRQLALYANDQLLRVDCHRQPFMGTGCKVEFPFESFGAEVGFHHDHVSRWREIIDFADAFLRSKQFRQQ